ncbi:MAG: tetratricopeptide repeat protein [Acidobacteriota bacterium]
MPRLKPFVLTALLSAVAVNGLYPGEVFYQARFVLLFAAFLGLLVVLAHSVKTGNAARATAVCRKSFVPLVAVFPAVLFSVNRWRTEEVFWLFLAYSCLFAVVQLLTLTEEAYLWAFLVVAGVSFCVELHALYQHLTGLSALREAVNRSEFLDESFRSGLLSRLATRRVFANFALPNTLAGFLVIGLPLQAYLFRRGVDARRTSPAPNPGMLHRVFRHPAFLPLMGGQLALLGVCLLLTKSFGGWVCLLVSMAAVGSLSIPRSSFRKPRVLAGLAGLLTLLVAWMAWLTHSRGFGLLELSAAENPIALRWINFTTALKIVRDFPLTGVGLGNYGTLNPRYQSSPLFVTQYAHNTPLQLLAEGGLALFLLSALALLWILAGRTRPSQKPDAIQVALIGALAAWSAHNLLDINLYFPSVGGLGILILALLCKSIRDGWETHSATVRQESHAPRSTSATRASWLWGGRGWVGLWSGGLLLATVLVCKSYLAQTFFVLASESVQGKDYERAGRLGRYALFFEPAHPEILILNAKLDILRANPRPNSDKPGLLRNLRNAYEQAVKSDPFNAEYHHELGRVLGALGDRAEADRMRERAMQLFPSEGRYRPEDH